MDTDFQSAIIEEVALEGLEGVTVEALWLRLKERKNFPLAIDEKSKAFIWRCVVSVREFTFLLLKEERRLPILYNKFKCIDPHTGNLVELVLNPDDEVYPLKTVSDGDIQGSCATYWTRQDITADIRDDKYQPQISLQEIEDRYSCRRLVILASQKQRRLALCGSEFDPSLKFPDTDYCMLERIGRSRYDGEISGGAMSLDIFNLAQKTLFYYTLKLTKLGLVRKQNVTVCKPANDMKRVSRTVFHLTRFFHLYQTKGDILLPAVTNYLLQCPGRQQETVKLREDLQIEQKVFKKLTHRHRKKFLVHLVKYRTLHPDAEEKEYLSSKTHEERDIRVVELLDDTQSDDDEDDEEEKVIESDKALHTHQYTYERSLIRQATNALLSAGRDGLSQWDISHVLNIDYTSARAAVKTLVRKDMVYSIVKEVGKQKMKMYIAKGLSGQSKLLTDFNEEKEKLIRALQQKEDTPETPKKDDIPAAESVQNQDAGSRSDVSENASTKVMEEPMETNGDDNSEIFLPANRTKCYLEEVDRREKVYTIRQIKRMNYILDIIHQYKILDNEYAFVKLIKEKEKDEGLNIEICKRSVIRLLNILIKTKKIRSIKTVLTDGTNTKQLHLLMERDIEPTDPRVTSLIAQCQLRLIGARKEEKPEKKEPSPTKPPLMPDNIPQSAKESIVKMHQYRSLLKPKDMVTDSKVHMEYGYQHKYLRAQIIHQLLFYLIYGYKGKRRDPNPTEGQDGDQQEGQKEGQDPGKNEGQIQGISEVQSESSQGEVEMEHDGQEKCQSSKATGSESVEGPEDGCASLEQEQMEQDKGQNSLEQTEGQNDEVKTPDVERGKSENSSKGQEGHDLDTDEKKMQQEEIKKMMDSIKEPPVYLDEYTWKRYLAPLPKHEGYDKEGWALLSDVVIQLPLCIFCSVTNISHRIAGLKELLRDPVKSLYPVTSLPSEITQQLLYARKYIYAVHTACTNLAFFGLLTFGPQLMKEKDKVFVYLHRKATLLDTQGSNEGCCVTSLQKQAETMFYHFTAEENLEHYWTDLRQFAFNSNLGHSNCMDPECNDEDITYSLYDAVQNKEVSQVEDSGLVPGNRKGAGGMDSSLFLHLTRNWCNSSETTRKYHYFYNHRRTEKGAQRMKVLGASYMELSKGKETLRLPSILPKERLTLLPSAKGKEPEVVKVVQTTGRGNKGGKGIKRKSAADHILNKKFRVHKDRGRVAKKDSKKKLYDEADRKAFSNMQYQRVKWTPRQDTVLLVCKIAIMVMDKRNRTLVSYLAIRDLLHKQCPLEGMDKTSGACQRRIQFLLKADTNKNNINVFYAEAMHDPYVAPFSKEKYLQHSPETIQKFNTLANYLIQKMKIGESPKVVLPQTLSDWSNFNMTTMSQSHGKKQTTFRDVENRSHVMEATVNNILHSYLSCNDKYGRSQTMFKVLKQYPDILLDSILNRMCEDGHITRNKRENVRSTAIGTGIRKVKISQRYWYRFLSRIPTSLFQTALQSLQGILDISHNEETQGLFQVPESCDGGIVAAAISLLYHQQLSSRVLLSKDLVTLDEAKSVRGYIYEPLRNRRKDEEEKEDKEEEEEEEDSDEEEDRKGLMVDLDATEETPKENSTPDQVEVESMIAYNITPTVSFLLPSEDMDPPMGEDQSLGTQGGRPTLPFKTASRSLITMRRSKAASELKLRHFTFQGNFLIAAPEIHFGVKMPEGGDIEGHNENDEGIIEQTDIKLLSRQFFQDPALVKDIIYRQTQLLPMQVKMKDVWQKVDIAIRSSVMKTYKMIMSAGDIGIRATDLRRQHGSVAECDRNLNILQKDNAIRSREKEINS